MKAVHLKWLKAAFYFLLPIFLSACGGGGSTNAAGNTGASGSSISTTPTPAPTTNINGLAATGGAIPNADVTAKCVEGPAITGTTGSDGGFSLTLTSSHGLPCILEVSSTASNLRLYSFAITQGHINVTPLTDMVVANASAGDPAVAFSNFNAAIGNNITANLMAAELYVKAQLASAGMGTPSIDILTGSFKIGDSEDHILDSLGAALVASGRKISDLSALAAAGSPMLALVQSQSGPGAGTNTGTGATDTGSGPSDTGGSTTDTGSGTTDTGSGMTDTGSGTSSGSGAGSIDCAGVNSATGPCIPNAPAAAWASSFSPVQQEAYGGDWSMFRGGSSHTGYMPIDVNVGNVTQVWQWNVGASHQQWYSPSWPTIQPVAVNEGKVFATTGKLGDPHQTVYAIDLQTGNELWNEDLGNLTMVGPPAANNGKVVVSYESGDASAPILANGGQPAGLAHYVTFLSSGDGTILNRTAYSSQTNKPLPTIFDGTVFNECESYGGICSLDLTTGAGNWQTQNMAQVDAWTPAVDANYIYSYAPPTCAVQFGCLPSALYTYQKGTGQLIGYIPASIETVPIDLGGSFYSSPIIGSHGNVVVYGGYNTNYPTAAAHAAIASFDIATQQRSWQLLGNYRGQPALANGVIYAQNRDPMRIEAIDEGTGTILWTASVAQSDEQAYVGDPVVTNNCLIFSTNKQVYMVDLASKQVVWSYPSAAEIAVTSDGHLLLSLATKVPDTQWVRSDMTKPALTTGNVVAFSLK